MRPGHKVRTASVCALLALAHARLGAAQEAWLEQGVVGLGLTLRQLDGEKRVLLIGAHPDDEDNGLLATLERADGVRAAYLSLSRGEGGQNVIGLELSEGLGVLRTGELLSARRVDGAEQFFSRAYDFGFSKSAEEALRLWPRDSILSDVVWVVRTFRPHVIVSMFGGTPRDGHGQHQMAGIMAREAFEAAGDRTRFPEHLQWGARPWRPLKLYRRSGGFGFGFGDPGADGLTVESGRFDPLLGQSYFQLAMASRSRHRSQDMGSIQPAGPRQSRMTLWSSHVTTEPTDTSLFAGVDTTLAGLTSDLAIATRRSALDHVERYRAAIRSASADLGVFRPGDVAPRLAEALAEARALLELASAAGEARAELVQVMRERVAGVSRALLAAASVVLDVRVDDDIVVPGQELTAEIELWNAGPFEVRAAPATLEGSSFVVVSGPGGAAGAASAEEVTVPAGAVRTWRFRLRVQHESGSAYPSEPYYLRRPMDGWIYSWPDDPALRAQPFNPPPLEGAVDMRLVIEERGGSRPAAVVPVRASVAAGYRGEDRMAGELRRPILVVPRISVQARPRPLIWPLGAQAARTVTVTVRSAAPDPAAGSLRLELPAGWVSQPSERRFQLAASGGTELTFDLRAPANAPVGEFPVRIIVQDEQGSSYSRGYALVDYPHVEPVPLFEDAVTTVKVFPVAVAQGRRIGYVMGAGDEVPEAIRQLGPEVEMIGSQMLESGDLGRFAVIVIGVRAYEVRPDLASANQRLLDYARAGGVLLVQYNQYEYPDGGFAPYPVTMQRPHDRITDETARVTILDPASPVFAEPNRITAADFAGWVQERSLYMLSDWDAAYSPQLEMADPGEPPKRGGLIVGRLGEGLYVYTGLAFFRQLPAGVPGAYRLFANLLSLDPSRWPARAGNGAR